MAEAPKEIVLKIRSEGEKPDPALHQVEIRTPRGYGRTAQVLIDGEEWHVTKLVVTCEPMSLVRVAVEFYAEVHVDGMAVIDRTLKGAVLIDADGKRSVIVHDEVEP